MSLRYLIGRDFRYWDVANSIAEPGYNTPQNSDGDGDARVSGIHRNRHRGKVVATRTGATTCVSAASVKVEVHLN